jgi:pyruvate dehydrogenase E2 component (dihydrolipoamide acetyltransferase)/2-oxoisovalerate dehydrogenase E2 component (dihydrolipoyl transacylase)
VPQFSYFEDVDVARLIQLRDNSNKIAAKHGRKISYMPFFIKALQITIKEFPVLNSSVDMDRNCHILHKEINVGIAMATPLGLIVPVLKGVQNMSLNEIIEAYEALKTRSQEMQLTSSDMKEATVTLSNYGSIGDGKWATPMVIPPEVAIVAISKIFQAPVVKNGTIVVGDLLNFSFSFDHRVIDGELAAKISMFFCKLLKDPAVLLADNRLEPAA